MPNSDDSQERLRPCDVIIKLLKSKHAAAPFTKDEMEILSGYLSRLHPAKLGGFAKKGIAEMSDEDFGDIIKGKIAAVVESTGRRKNKT